MLLKLYKLFYVVMLKLANLFSRLFYGWRATSTQIQLCFKSPNGILISGINMTIIARIDQQVNFSPVFKDAGGNDVTEFGSIPAWSLSDDALATLVVSEDGMQATVTPKGHIGDVEVSMVIDADPEEGVEEIVGKATISFKAGKVAFISLSGTVSSIVTPVEPVEPETPAEGEVVEPAPGEDEPDQDVGEVRRVE